MRRGRSGPQQDELRRLNHDQYTVAAALGGRLIPQRRFGGWDLPDVELRRGGLTVRTGVEYHGEGTDARLLRWIRIASPVTMQWRVPRLTERGRRDLPPPVHELLKRLERDVAGVDLDRTGFVVWLSGTEPDPAAVRAAIDRTISVVRKLLIPNAGG
jgi:hypothetical protein